MQILILGATGRTGKLLLRQALLNGYTVNILLRDKSRVPAHPELTAFEGSPADSECLGKAMQGCQAVLSALNISRQSDFPWARLRTPVNLLSETAKCIIDLAPKNGINRVILTSAWGAGDTKADIPWWFKWLIDHSNIGPAYRDHERQEQLFAASTLNYTFLRPAGLINSTKSKNIITSFHNLPKPHLTIGRGDVAKFMLKTLQHDLFIRQMPVISA